MSFLTSNGLITLGDQDQRDERCTAGSPQEATRSQVTISGPNRIRSVKLIVGGLLFVVLTVGVFWYQFSRIQTGESRPRWSNLEWEYFFLMLLCLPIDTLCSGVRIWVVCRVLQPGVSFWTCLKAEWANVGVSMLTPSQTGGGVGQVYVLNRGGASVGTALTISLISFLGSVVALLCVGFYSVLISDICQTGRLFQGAIWSFTLISALMMLGAVWPGLFRAVVSRISKATCQILGKDHHLQNWWPPSDSKIGPPKDSMGPLAGKLVDIVYNYRYDVVRFLRLGRSSFVFVCLLSLTFMFSRSLMAFLCVRFLGVETSNLAHVIEVQMALIFFIYFAPTPGGSGMAEGISLSLMADLVPNGFAPYYNLLWRGFTLYLPAIAGLLCLMHAITKDARRFVCGRCCFEPRGGN